MKGYLRMMKHSGISPVEYRFELAVYPPSKKKSDKLQPSFIYSDYTVNHLIGKKIKLNFNEEIRCIDCGKITKKSFNQGSCYTCFTTLASNDFCILKPETCHFHLGTCREPEWGKENCFKKHTVYLANTSGVKVGITKENPVTKRWVDQGAMYAIPILEVESRREAGLVEIEFANFVTDKTSWQKNTSSDSEKINLLEKRDELLRKINIRNILSNFKLSNAEKEIEIKYPIQSYPKKKVAYKVSKEKPIEDVLVGVKGQYLLFESGVINTRAYEGYYVEIELP